MPAQSSGGIYNAAEREVRTPAPGKTCKTTVLRIYGENREPLPGWERPAFGIALAGELLERMTQGQTLAEIAPGGSTNIEALFSESDHTSDRVMACASFGWLLKATEGRPVDIVTDCVVEVFQALQAAQREITAEASRLLSWVTELWPAAGKNGSRRLEPTAASHWTTLCYVRGRDDLHILR